MPERWIERVFGEMEALYGARFHDAWRGTNLAAVKAMWAQKLAGFAEDPRRIRFALNALDDKPFPPTLPEFVALCRQAPRQEVPALPEPTIEPEVAAARAQEIREKAVSAIGLGAGYGWAIRILQDVAAGVAFPSPASEQLAVDALADLGKLSMAPAEYVAMNRAAWRRVTERAA